MSKLTSEELAYIAGIVDGEAYVGVAKNGRVLTLWVVITTKDEGLMNWLAWKLNTALQGPYKYQERAKPQWSVRLSNKRVVDLLQVLEPYLIVKKAHARLASEYPLSTTGVKIGEANRVKRQTIRVAMSALNTE